MLNASIVCGAVLLAPLPAVAHAILMASQPEAGATVPAGPAHIVLRFNSHIDQARSRLALRAAADAPPTVLPLTGSSTDTLVSDVELAPGKWVLRWQVLAIDGHMTRGDVPITVQAR